MKMSYVIKKEGDLVAKEFLANMPEGSAEVFFAQDQHQQLSYFYCWCKLMQQEADKQELN